MADRILDWIADRPQIGAAIVLAHIIGCIITANS